MKKSMSLNAVMNALKTLMSVIFPLITFPYASNVLQVENLGKVNFANSVCGYFLLFAGLGISSYAGCHQIAVIISCSTLLVMRFSILCRCCWA